MPDCVPPQSLATWSALLLYGAIALGVEALALLFTLRPARGGSWGWPALRGVLLACALAAAIWSLTIRASAQAIYQRYVALFDWNPDAATVVCTPRPAPTTPSCGTCKRWRRPSNTAPPSPAGLPLFSSSPAPIFSYSRALGTATLARGSTTCGWHGER